jgi:acyl carrier protein
MTPDEAHQILVDAFLDVAPDCDPTTVDGDANYRDALAIDSMDFLNILELVANETGIEVPESDYDRIMTFDGFVAYLCA